MAGRTRVYVNPWLLILLPLVACGSVLAVSLLIASPDVLGVVTGLMVCIVLVPLVWALSTSVLILRESGVWWIGGHLKWRTIHGFVVREYVFNDLWWPFHVASAVTDGRSVDVYATARWRRSRVELLVTLLDVERRHWSS